MAIKISMEQMLDITGPEAGVEVEYLNGVLWVNVDGVCRLRVCQITPSTEVRFNCERYGSILVNDPN